ncbi:MAG: DNA helicase RecQ [Spirochaetales bacterium]
MQSPRETLQNVFGFSEFRPHQGEIVEAILAGRDVFAALPTGGGKSLCYQLPALHLRGITIVVSPLIALMHDQVTGATQYGVRAAYLNSSQSLSEQDEVFHRARAGEVQLLYVSPERFARIEFRNRLQPLGVSLFAVDEAHCISEWGHEFRPDYRALTIMKDEFPDTTVAAFTATATAAVQQDVIELLSLDEPLVVRGDFDRKEITYRVARKQKASEQVKAFVDEHRDEPGIIYRATRDSVEQTAVMLTRQGHGALPYHAGLDDAVRARNQEAFVNDEVQIIVATIAFGMGIDKSNVRWVLHGDLPRSLEAYYQESGRAGRDGAPAVAMLLYGAQDIAKIRYHIERMQIDRERERAEANLTDILRYANAQACRRTQLLAHFEQSHAGSCANCDICLDEHNLIDHTVAAQKAMSAMVRTGERFGAHYIADIVTGEANERAIELGHTSIPTFGVGSDHAKAWWVRLINDMEAAGLVRRRDGRASGLAVTPQGKRVLFGKQTFLAAEPDERALRSGSAAAKAAPPASESLDPDDERLYACLKALRLTLAREQNVPPYVIFSDKTLRHMATLRPSDEASFLSVHGVGAVKAKQYATLFMSRIATFLASGECGADVRAGRPPG